MKLNELETGILAFLHRHFIRWLFVVPILATLNTWLCYHYQWTFELRALVTIFFAGVFFAFAVIMNTANVRRFQAFDEIATIKSLMLSFWQIGAVYLNEREKVDLKHTLVKFMQALRQLVKGEVSPASLQKVDHALSRIITNVEIIREKGMASPEVSRLLQWHQQMHLAIEKLLMIKGKRTPLSLRLFVAVVLVLALFVLAPQFALFGYYGIATSAIVSTVMVSLIFIQDMLENPFGDDIDDIKFRSTDQLYGRLQ